MMPGMGDPAGRVQTPPPVIPGTSSDNTVRGAAKISGIILDSASRQPVEFASVALINVATGKPIDGASADDKGRFTITRVPVGEFNLLISFVGYRNKTVRSIRVVTKGDEVNTGIVNLRSDTKTLNEVTVTGQAALIEEKVDRLVYNADKDIMSKGGDATDVMRKVPLLSVDLDGNVSLRGSQNVRVLINNKPSTIVASSVGDALKQIPADMIKSVEVITSPSAKYDAEGTAGIINIITKKNTLQGATLSLDTGVGNRGANLGLNGSLRTGKMGFNLGGFGRANYNVRGAFDNTQRTFAANGVSTTHQIANTMNEGAFGQYTLSWDYDISKYSALTASVRFGLRNNITTQDNLRTETSSPNSTSMQVGLRDVLSRDNSNTVDANIDYTRTFEKPQKEFSISGQFSRNTRENNFTADILNNVDLQTIISRQRNVNPSYNQESTLQIDYQTPLAQNQLIEFGGKAIMRKVNSQFSYLLATPPSLDQFLTDGTRPGNTLNYNQDIAATYISYTYTSKTKYTIKVGSRYEYTFINANFSREGSDQSVNQIPDYANFVPSINISKALKGGKIIKIAYNRRIQRPGIQSLNPNINAANPLNVSQGNPNLRPELNDNFEFSSSTYVKSVYISGSLFARFSSNAITNVTTTSAVQIGTNATNPVFQNALFSTPQNIGTENAYGLNLFGNATLFSKWQIGGGVDAYVAYLKGQIPTAPTSGTDGSSIAGGTVSTSNAGLVISGRFNTSVALKNGWGIQAFTFARGRQVQLQGYDGGFIFYSMGAKKDFKSKKGSVGLAAENFIVNPLRIRSVSETPGVFSRNSLTSRYNLGFRVNFSYRIGKMSFDQPQRRKRGVNNDDVKEGEGGGDNAGGGQQQQAPAGGQQGGGGRRPR
ncbi:MAG: TonB-dependent receptor [Rudanella sp.]|nr:TonB-dependent receptor [Rudanella sp.]